MSRIVDDLHRVQKRLEIPKKSKSLDRKVAGGPRMVEVVRGREDTLPGVLVTVINLYNHLGRQDMK